MFAFVGISYGQVLFLEGSNDFFAVFAGCSEVGA